MKPFTDFYRLLHGPWGFLGLGIGNKCPSLISFGYSPVSAAILRISAISLNTTSGASFINSAGILSGPVLLLFLSLLAHNFISSGVNGFSSFTGCIYKKGVTFSKLNRDSKKEVIISVFCSGSFTISLLSLVTTTFVCSFLFRFLIASQAFLSGLGNLLIKFIFSSSLSISNCFFLFLISLSILFLSFLSSTLLV